MWKILVCVVFGTELLQSAEACRTNTQECSDKRAAAEALNDPEARCLGYVAYLECVKADIADCEEGATDTAYPQNLVDMYCNNATICSAKLNKCYANFTAPVIETIISSDATTKQAICAPLAVQIMSCTDKVTAECSDLPGLLETVGTRQASFNATCGQSVPCVYQIMQCQAHITTMLSPKTSTSSPTDTEPTAVSSCSGVAEPDYCAAYKQTVTCMKEKVQECTSVDNFSNIISNLQETANVMCSDNTTCQTKLNQCMCQLEVNPTDPFSGICTNLPKVQTCISNMPASCQQVAVVAQTIQTLNQQYAPLYNSFCSQFCPQAMQCLANMGMGGLDTSTMSSSSADSGLDMSQLCRRVQPVFGCFQTASTACNVEQSKATFPQVEAKFMELCEAMLPQAVKLGTCQSYRSCSLSWSGFPNMTAMASGNMDPSAAMQATMAMLQSMLSTNMWCSYLEHGAKCIADTANSCGLSAQFASSVTDMYQSTKQMCGTSTETGGNSNTNTNTGGTGTGGAGTGESSGNNDTGAAESHFRTSSLYFITAAFIVSRWVL